MKGISTIILLIVFLIAGCCEKEHKSESGNGVSMTKSELDEQLIQVNKRVLITEKEQIDFMVKRYDWKMTVTETGLRYRIFYKSPNTYFPVDGDIVKLSYALKDIKGDLIYSSQRDGDLAFQLGKSDQPSGLQEAIRLMNKGDKANIVVPSHLAYGLTGDGNMIIGKTTLVYSVELVEIIKHAE